MKKALPFLKAAPVSHQSGNLHPPPYTEGEDVFTVADGVLPSGAKKAASKLCPANTSHAFSGEIRVPALARLAKNKNHDDAQFDVAGEFFCTVDEVRAFGVQVDHAAFDQPRV